MNNPLYRRVQALELKQELELEMMSVIFGESLRGRLRRRRTEEATRYALDAKAQGVPQAPQLPISPILLESEVGMRS